MSILKNILSVFVLVAIMILAPNISNATHIVGGDLTYKCLGNSQYEITLTVRRDCINAAPDAPFDDPATLAVFDKFGSLQNGIGVAGRYYMPLISVTPIENSLQNDCRIPKTGDHCVEEAVYKVIATLPYNKLGYTLAYQRCCRNTIINNILSPLETGATYYVDLTPQAMLECNSQPVFEDWASMYICVGEKFTFNHTAIDPDGDEIVYSLCSPSIGASLENPNPTVPSNPPYATVTWGSGYSQTDVFGPGGDISMTTDGMLMGTANELGTFLVGVCINEYRDGVLISQVRRDFQYNVLQCEEAIILDCEIADNDCDGDNTISIINRSTGADSYTWNFNYPSTDPAFISTDANPTFTYPNSGKYTIRKEATRDSDGCSVIQDFVVSTGQSFLDANFNVASLSCLDDVNVITLTDTSVDPTGTTCAVEWTWTIDIEGAITTLTGNPVDLNVESASSAVITLEVINSSGCASTITRTIDLSALFPTSDIVTTLVECSDDDYTISVENVSTTTIVETEWRINQNGITNTRTGNSINLTIGDSPVRLVVMTTFSSGCNSTKNYIINPEENFPTLTINNNADTGNFNCGEAREITFSSGLIGGNVNGDIASYLWTDTDGNVFTSETVTYTLDNEETITLSLAVTYTNGCELVLDNYTYTAAFDNNVDLDIDEEVNCAASPVRITLTNQTSVNSDVVSETWTVNGVVSTGSQVSFDNQIGGSEVTYDVVYNNGCTGSYTNSYQFGEITPQAAYDLSIVDCINDQLSIQISDATIGSGYTQSWTINGTTYTNSPISISALPEDQINISYTVTSQYGCTSTITDIITAGNITNVGSGISNFNIEYLECTTNGFNFLLTNTGTNTNNSSWTITENGMVTQTVTGSPVTVAITAENFQITLMGEGTGPCDGDKTISYNLNQFVPSLDINTNYENATGIDCEPFITLTATLNPALSNNTFGTPTYNWSYTINNGPSINSTGANLQIALSNGDSGTATLTASFPNGCTLRATENFSFSGNGLDICDNLETIGALDCDNDGITNQEECDNGTDPLDPCSNTYTTGEEECEAIAAGATGFADVDCDGGGVNDEQECDNGTDPTDPCDDIPNLTADMICDNIIVYGPFDCDGDGVTNEEECDNGTDPTDPCSNSYETGEEECAAIAAGATGFADVDCDGGGVNDEEECDNGTDPTDPCDDFGTATAQYICDNLVLLGDFDCDGDGETNEEECDNGTDPTDPCSNSYVTGEEECEAIAAGATGFADVDCDGGGVNDEQECDNGTDPTDPCDDFGTATAQYICDNLVLLGDFDCDGDGETNEEECDNGTDPTDPCSNSYETGEEECAAIAAGAIGFADVDCDGGGVNDEQECEDGTDPTDPCDDLGTVTAQYICDNLTIYASLDCDGDGETNQEECDNGTDPTDPCSNSYETGEEECAAITAGATGFADVDCDGGGVNDEEECDNGTDPTDPCDDFGTVTAVYICDNLAFFADFDCDGDGETNEEECDNGTDPTDPCSNSYETGEEECEAIAAGATGFADVDCDGGGVNDEQECDNGTDPTNPCDDIPNLTADVICDNITVYGPFDCDGDGETNEEECDNGTDPTDPCSNSYQTGKEECEAIAAGATGFADVDCDGGGVNDEQECDNGTDPTDPCDDFGTATAQYICDNLVLLADFDCDGDGETNEEECDNGTDPTDPCSNSYETGEEECAAIAAGATGFADVDCDGGGVNDEQECEDGTDPTDPCDDLGTVTAQYICDNLIIYAALDCDGDGQTNEEECNNGTDPTDPCSNSYASGEEECEAIAAGATGFADVDCDGGGVNDEEECANGTDPTDPCDDFGLNPEDLQYTATLIECVDGQGLFEFSYPLDQCFDISSIVWTIGGEIYTGSPVQVLLPLGEVTPVELEVTYANGEVFNSDANPLPPLNPNEYTNIVDVEIAAANPVIGCDGVFELSIVDPIIGADYMWYSDEALTNVIGTGTTLVDSTNLENGTVYAEVFNLADCTYGTGQIMLEDNSLSVIIGDEYIICAGDTTNLICAENLNSLQVVTYEWKPADQIITGNNLPCPTIGISETETENFSLILCTTNEFGCTQTDTIDFIISNSQTVEPFTFEPDSCGSMTINFMGPDNFTGDLIWDFGDGTTSTEFDPTHTYENEGSYNVTINSATGECTEGAYSAVVSVPYMPFIEIVTTTADTIFYEMGSDVILEATTTNTGDVVTWCTEGNIEIAIGNPITYTPTAEEETIFAKVTDPFGCSAIDSVVLIDSNVFNENFVLMITLPDAVCVGEEFMINAVPAFNTDGMTVEWLPADCIVANGNTFNPTVTTQVPKTFTAIVIDAQGEVVLEQMVDVNVIVPEVSIGADNGILGQEGLPQVCEGSSIDLFAEPNDAECSYTWSNGDTGSEITVEPTENTSYTITCVTPEGCEASSSIDIEVMPPSCDATDIFVPNAFSPNDDNVNDQLFVRSKFVKEVEFFVVNRWGQEVWRTTNQDQGWDGTYNGERLAPDAFSYCLKVTCVNDETYTTTGNVSIIK